jgi:hypothetical protein
VDGRGRDVAEPAGAVVAQQREPAEEGAGDGRGEQAGAGNQVETEIAIALDRRGRRGDGLGAEDGRRRAG